MFILAPGYPALETVEKVKIWDFKICNVLILLIRIFGNL